jgi:hypothetical protein
MPSVAREPAPLPLPTLECAGAPVRESEGSYAELHGRHSGAKTDKEQSYSQCLSRWAGHSFMRLSGDRFSHSSRII